MFPATSGARTARKNIRQIAGDEPGLSLLVAFVFFWPWKHVGHIKFVIEAFDAHFELRAVDTKATTVRSASSNRVACGHEDEGRSARKSAILLFAGHSILGYGIQTSSHQCRSELHKLNYKINTWVTRCGISPPWNVDDFFQGNPCSRL